MIEFSQLKVSFFLEGGEVIHLRLRAYYRESSLSLMRHSREYSSVYGVSTKESGRIRRMGTMKVRMGMIGGGEVL
ncbi:MAG: hypothetical protein R2758_16335 [Bacteroidales bacterium]